MDKYKGLTELTKDILNGQLCDLSLNYESLDMVKVKLEYKDDMYRYAYYLEIKKDDYKIIESLHESIGRGSEIELHPNQEFEEAILEYLFKKKGE